MPAGIDISQQRFGRLVAQDCFWDYRSQVRRWRCLCDCGTISKPIARDLRCGKTRSCGCLRTENGKTKRNKEVNNDAQ